MKETIFAFIFALVLPFTPAYAGARNWKTPAGVEFPRTVTPSTGENSDWRKDGGSWLLTQRQTGYLDSPAWWQDTRPPRDQLVVLEVEYLDDLTAPVRAEVYSGLGTIDPYSAIHRFGGRGNGQWSTARIPVTSDFLRRYQPEGSLRFRLRPIAGTLRARAFRLVAPEADEEARYNATTREWVEREQQRATIADRYYELAQQPALEGDWAGRPLVPYQRNWMNLVRTISAPQPGESDGPWRVRMFRNEFEPLQVGVYANGASLENVSVSVDPLRGAGAEVASVKVRVAEYSKVRGQMIPGFLIEPFPQRLWPAYSFDVPEGRSHLVWLEFRTEEESAKPGTYKSVVRFRADGVEEVAVPIEVEILDARLLTMEEAGLKLGGCTRGLLPEFELEFLKERNHNMVNIWYAGVRPVLSKRGDSFDMDFRLMDEWMAAARRAGMTDMVYFLGGNPYGFPHTMHLPRTLAEDLLGIDGEEWRKRMIEDPDELPDDVASLVVEWARRFGEHAGANDWPNVILTPFDEPAKFVQYRPDLGMLGFIKPQFKSQVKLLRQGDPDVQIYGSIHHYDSGIPFLEDVDIFCTNAVHENWNLPEEVRAAGKTLWEYSGNSDKGLPAVARYTFGFYFAAHDSRGSLVWAYNWGNRFDTLDGSNWMYVWNTPFDVIPTPYMEGLREAWDDRRLLETLKKRASERDFDLTPFLGQLYAEIAAARGQGGTSTLDDFWERAADDLIMDSWRDRMVRKLLSLQ